MRDHHVHFGQFHDIYYPATVVFDTVFETEKIEEIFFTSTTTCISGIEYSKIEKEISNSLDLFGCSKTRPLLWYKPDYIEQGVSLAKMLDNIPYAGFKLHPQANLWDLDNIKHIDILNQIFSLALEKNLPVIIHTGENGIDSPDRFKSFFSNYSNVACILAHCRPVHLTMQLFRQFPQLLGDTAFAPPERLEKLINNGFSYRIITGTDFPITHFYYSCGRNGTKTLSANLRIQYSEDLKTLEYYHKRIRGNLLLASSVKTSLCSDVF